jgi:hypothetical protein
MAASFNATTQYFNNAVSPVITYPFTVGMWDLSEGQFDDPFWSCRHRDGQ